MPTDTRTPPAPPAIRGRRWRTDSPSRQKRRQKRHRRWVSRNTAPFPFCKGPGPFASCIPPLGGRQLAEDLFQGEILPPHFQYGKPRLRHGEEQRFANVRI